MQAVGSLWRELQERVKDVIIGYKHLPDEKMRMVRSLLEDEDGVITARR
jgi:hypothetical protein